MTVSSATTRQDVVERAKRLFTFLTQVQRLRTRTVRSVETYASHGGSVLWLADLPDHPAVTVPGRDSAPQPSEPILVVDRYPRPRPHHHRNRCGRGWMVTGNTRMSCLPCGSPGRATRPTQTSGCHWTTRWTKLSRTIQMSQLN